MIQMPGLEHSSALDSAFTLKEAPDRITCVERTEVSRSLLFNHDTLRDIALKTDTHQVEHYITGCLLLHSSTA